ncbi:MAG: hypothetical protein GX640_13980 [Fibrobacter sp.]|mgnify:CR=1 FL=1|nr:hypothetical protein [Fibrobacter sp.]
MSTLKKAAYLFALTIIIFQLNGCGQKRPSGGDQQNSDTTRQQNGTPSSDTTKDSTR